MNIKKEKRRAYRRDYYRRFKDRDRVKILAASRRSYYKNREKRLAEASIRNKRLWREKRDEMRARMRGYSRKWRANNISRAKHHARASTFRRKFGITIDQYDQMLNAQGGVCAICRRQDGTSRLAVDHCHATNIVRGLLCRSCNVALGKFDDDPDLLRRALAYLIRIPV